jgi:Tfp pilus assembly protein PilZ
VSSIERQHPRFAADVAVQFHVGKKVVAGRTRNVSRGGLCADTDETMALGSDVQIAITLVFDDMSKSEPLRLPARIVWCTSVDSAFQVGVAFRPLDAKRAEYLRLFLKYLGDEKAPKSVKPDNIDDRFG